MHHYMFIIAQLWLTSDLRSTVVLLDTGTLGTNREIFGEDADGETPRGHHQKLYALQCKSNIKVVFTFMCMALKGLVLVSKSR